MILENIRLAFSSMAQSKMRTLLSLLGIVIGVASVVAILNLGESATDSMMESLSSGGLDMLTITPRGAARETEIFTDEFPDALMRNVSGIRTTLPVLSSSAFIRNGQEVLSGCSVQGVTSSFFEENALEAYDGAFFTLRDNINRRQAVVLGRDLADELFPAGGAVGSYISIFRRQAKSYLVVGVLENKDATLGVSYDYAAFIPYNTYEQRFRRVSQVSSYIVKVEEGYDPLKVSEDIEAYLDAISGPDYYMLFSPATMVEMAGEITGTFTAFLAAIAAISLLVGGIGIMNIMLVSVVERTREIGIRKALGATPRIIRAQFLVESAMLTLSGGLLGVLLGSLLSYAVVTASGWNLHISIPAMAISLAFSAFIGIFFGYYPASKASRLDPIEALSRE